MKGFDPNTSAAATASNWRRVLFVDGLMGAMAAAAGAVLAFVWSPFGGAVLGALGLLYVFAVIRRYQGFKDIREASGLDV